jgi:hypothetical protein
MKVVVDASVFTQESGAFGNISGAIELSFEPHVGDSISFVPIKSDSELPPEFSGIVRVENRIITPGGDKHGLLISLEDITVPTVADAQALMAFFEDAHGLFANIYDEDDEGEDADDDDQRD